MVNWLHKLIFMYSKNPYPDGRPLYAYKLRDKDYADLRNQVREQFVGGPPDDFVLFPLLFCLFAAEAWRRCHSGGHWAWKTVFDEIGQPVPPQSWIAEMVEKGLKWWGRNLLTYKDGGRAFLVTIACEGGLPLKLLQQDNSRLARYFRKVLTQWHREKRFGREPGLTIAEENSTILPSSLRRDIVYRLTHDLIGKIIELQEKVADASDPLAELDRIDPNWRQDLPLPLEDATAEVLLKNLVREAWKLSLTNKIRWRHLLRRLGEDWRIERILDLPRQLTGEVLEQWCGSREVAGAVRLRLLLEVEEEQRQIGLLTRIAGTGEDNIYRCEGVSGREIRLRGNRALAAAPLFLSDGRDRFRIPVAGDHELGPLPWFFAETKNGCQFIGDGSVRSRADKVMAVVPEEGRFQGEADIEEMGGLENCSRRVVRVAGSGAWVHPVSGRVEFCCGMAEAETVTLILGGQRLNLPLAAGRSRPYLGPVRLFVVSDGGAHHAVSNARGEWRPDRTGAEWRPLSSGCAGRAWVRFLDQRGNLLLLRRIEMVPSMFSIKVDVRTEHRGSLLLGDPTLETVEAEQMEGYDFTTEKEEQGIRIGVEAREAMPAPQFWCRLSWGLDREMVLPLPLPCISAAFIRGDQPLPPQSRVPVSALSTIQAQVQQPAGSHFFSLVVDLWAKGARADREAVDRRIRLDAETGRGGFDLLLLQDQVTSLLALTGDIDACAVIKIVDHAQAVLAEIKAGLFELGFVLDKESGTVGVDEESRRRLEEDRRAQIEVSMMPLWNPEAQQVLLDPMPGEPYCWRTPSGLEPGPWLVCGEDGDWPRFRPVLWPIPGWEDSDDCGDFERAVKTEKFTERRQRLTKLVQDLATDPNHPDWPLVTGSVRLIRQYPAVTFELFQHLVTNPDAMVMALLKSDEEDFDSIWSLAGQLPFAWHLVPVASWKRAATLHVDSLRQALKALENGEELVQRAFGEFRERVTGRQPFFRQICDWLSNHLFPEMVLMDSELTVARQMPGFIEDMVVGAEQEFQARHDAEERYPPGPGVMQRLAGLKIKRAFHFAHLHAQLRPVRCAPFVAAAMAVTGTRYDRDFLREICRLRHFDQEWFDQAFALALCLELADVNQFSTEGDQCHE